MSNIITGLVPRSTATDATSGYQLDNAFGLYTLTLTSGTFVYVAGLKDDGISVFELGRGRLPDPCPEPQGQPPTTSPWS